MGTSNLERKPRAKVTWTGPEKGIGKMGKQAEAGSGACGELDCASQGGPGAGVGGCQPCGGLGWIFLWSPSQNGFGVPPHQRPGVDGRGERHSPAGSFQGPSLAAPVA